MNSPSASTAGIPIIHAKALHRVFRMGESQVEVLRGVNVTIRRGEFVAIEGRSGSGKSTLLHVLGALDGVDGGATEIDGRDYARPAGGLHGGWLAPFVRTGNALFQTTHGGWVLLVVCHALAIWRVIVDVFVLGLNPFRDLPLVLALICWATLIEVFQIFIRFLIWLAVKVLAVLDWITLFIRKPIDLSLDTLKREKQACQLRTNDFGFVFQFYHLLPELNVLQNTLLPAMIAHSALGYFFNRRSITARATQVLEQVGLSHRLTHRPSTLSGGERQRVAIARALMNNPRVLFADEPTGNLDAETGRQIMDLLEKLHQEGQTIVMVTHDRALAREADRVLVLTKGKLEKAE